MMLQYYTQKEALDEYVKSERAEATLESAINTTTKNSREVGLDDRTIISKLVR